MSNTDLSQLRSLPLTGLRHIALFGRKGSGKTSVFHSLIDSPSLDAKNPGPSVGLCDFGSKIGPVVVVDTASLNRAEELDSSEMKTTLNIVRRADVAVYIVDIRTFDREAYQRDLAWMNRNKIPHLLVFNKCDIAYVGDISRFKMEFPRALFLSAHAPDALALLRARLAEMIHRQLRQEPPLIPEHLVKEGDFVILVVPDSDKKAIRDPQTMIIEFLTRGVRCVISTESELQKTLEELPHVALVVAYARTFDKIRDIVPDNVRLTSYALLYGRQKGDLQEFASGARAISKLTEDSRVLIAEGCRCGTAHRDVGHVKIPRILREMTGENLHIDYCYGLDLPEDISQYDLVIHCGACSLSRRALQAHIEICQEAGVPIANFGTLLAQVAGVLDRCLADLPE